MGILPERRAEVNTCRLAGFCCRCYSNKKGRSNYKGHWGYQRPRPPVRRVRAMLRRRTPGEEYIDLAEPATAGSWSSLYPTLWEFLTRRTWEDGQPRETGTLLLFLDAMRLKACLSDRDAGLVAFVTGDTPVGLLEAVETGLVEDRLDWRTKGSSGKGKR